MKTLSENRCFGGVQGVYQHASTATGTDMTFGLFLPQEAVDGPVPVLWYLSGLTCTHENAMTKAGAQAHAAAAGIALIFPDTSPRGADVPDDEAFDLGMGASFYVNATERPWSEHYSMWDYIAEDLPDLVFEHFPLDRGRQAITGHSMGGHGALTLAMGLDGRYRSVSALAPICNPSASNWGASQFLAYIGADKALWAPHDASMLMIERGFQGHILVDTGTRDQFIDLLKPETLASAMAVRRQTGDFRLQRGYDHSYYFVSTFMADHVGFHAEHLWA